MDIDVKDLFGGEEQMREAVLNRIVEQSLHGVSFDEDENPVGVPTALASRISRAVDESVKATVGALVDDAVVNGLDVEYVVTDAYGGPGQTTTLRQEIGRDVAREMRDRYSRPGGVQNTIRDEARREATAWIAKEAGDTMKTVQAALSEQLSDLVMKALAQAARR